MSTKAIGVTIGGHVKVVARASFAARYAITLDVLVHRAEDAERGVLHEHLTSHDEEHAAYVTGAIIAAWSLVEASVNEVFADCADGRPPVGLPSDRVSRLAGLWRGGAVPRASPLAKAEAALVVCDAESMKGSHHHEDADLVRAIRNEFVHAEPEDVVVVTTLPGAQPTDKKLWERLRGRFDLHPTMGNAEAMFFPSKITSASCARWARHSVIAYLDEFYGRLRIRPHYEAVGQALLREARTTKR